MGFWNGTFKVVSNVVTLGGASRLEDAKTSYLNSYSEHERLCSETKRFKDEIEENVKAIGSFLTGTRPVLAKAEKVLRKSIAGKNNIQFKLTVMTLDSIERFNSDYNSAIGIGTGALAGGSFAVGSWALVGVMGSASTGAAISGLSGVAATNATLAWFGGGSLAAGGAGMSGGLAVLGGIVAIPLVCIASVGTHKKANEIQEEKVKLDATISKQRTHLGTLPNLLQLVTEKKFEIGDICDDFTSTSAYHIKIIRPFGILSALKQKILMLFKRRPFTEQQAESLSQLGDAVSDFLRKFRAAATAA